MKRFDWIDCDYSWDDDWPEKPVNLDLHRSTLSLLSQKLRRRPFERRKIFLWMSREAVPASASEGVFHISARFDFAAYRSADAAGKLAFFAEHVLAAIATAAPTLVAPAEVAMLAEDLRASGYTYHREDAVPVQGLVGIERCKAHFVHSPEDVTCELRLKRGRVAVRLPDGVFRRDELEYGRGVSACMFDGPNLRVETCKGNFTFMLDGAAMSSLPLATAQNSHWGTV